MSYAAEEPLASDYPFATLMRAGDREKIIAQVIESVWDTALRLPALLRGGP